MGTLQRTNILIRLKLLIGSTNRTDWQTYWHITLDSELPFLYFIISWFSIKSGKNIMYTFTIMVHIANIYLLFLPDFISWPEAHCTKLARKWQSFNVYFNMNFAFCNIFIIVGSMYYIGTINPCNCCFFFNKSKFSDMLCLI